MRGKLGLLPFRVPAARIIPAHAGQTRRSRWRCCRCPDHPRACGANFSNALHCSSGDGSSPRMRGKLMTKNNVLTEERIIPAHAGQTDASLVTLRRHPDHPRACGANLTSAFRGNINVGSSPRMRGKLLHRRTPVEIFRIIPAHAGQTLVNCIGRTNVSDHPRACGANSSVVSSSICFSGSSPRMRGKQLVV